MEPIARDYPTNLHVQALYAEVLVEAGRYQEAWMAARKALRCDERFVPAMIALVKASLAQGRVADGKGPQHLAGQIGQHNGGQPAARDVGNNDQQHRQLSPQVPES